MNVIKDVVFEGRILQVIEKALEFVRSQIKERTYLGADARFVTEPEYPEFAWKELIVNAVAHRDYSIKGTDIQIKMFDDRLTVESPVTLPGIVRLNNMRHVHFSRNPKIAQFWWTVDRAVMEAVRFKRTNETHGITFACKSGMLFITLPSGRRLAYVKPKIGTNKFGGDCITYEGVGSTKKWERLDSYGPKFVENIVQATARDILCYAMKTLRCCSIVMHIHDEVVIEADRRMSMQVVCDRMGRIPPWAKGLQLRADGYETEFYKKD